ncbi:hypothetical protein AB0M35_25915 [Micromonospora sp. NPDC051196]|uniref:hypothetical protein n=1 Tax=Micromonospora sp. NPDC051196 TaxID=3155281 RepID=UPI00342375C3
MVFSHFTLADRLDVLQDLLLDAECWTTQVVREELRAGSEDHRELAVACEAGWLTTAQLDTLDEVRCFTKWAARLGSGERDLGEASVLAAAELREGVAITDDRNATQVARCLRRPRSRHHLASRGGLPGRQADPDGCGEPH